MKGLAVTNMPRVSFTSHLQRFLDAPTVDVAGSTVGDVLGRVFEANPRLRGSVLDDQGHLRTHVNVFVGERPVEDRAGLSDAVAPNVEIYVLQALSGGCDRSHPCHPCHQ